MFLPAPRLAAAFRLVCLGIVIHPALAWPNLDSDTDQRNTALQSHFQQFQRLGFKTNDDGTPRFFTIRLNEHPVIVDGQRFDGFVFRAPGGVPRKDFVWSFAPPRDEYRWYILPEKGTMNGFDEYFWVSRDAYMGDRVLRPHGKLLVVQYLSGESFKPGEWYLIWFRFADDRPATFSLALTFAPRGGHKISDLRRILNLPFPK